MAYLPSLSEDAPLVDVFAHYPDVYRPLLDFEQTLLRGPSPLTTAERELIAAYVSGLNGSRYCHGVHTATAAALGIPAATVRAALDDIDSAPVDDRMKPLLRYARKVTISPMTITRDDAEAVLAAGWEEQALHDTVAVSGLFNMMNRLVGGLGIAAGEDHFAVSSQILATVGYAGLLPPPPREEAGRPGRLRVGLDEGAHAGECGGDVLGRMAADRLVGLDDRRAGRGTGRLRIGRGEHGVRRLVGAVGEVVTERPAPGYREVHPERLERAGEHGQPGIHRVLHVIGREGRYALVRDLDRGARDSRQVRDLALDEHQAVTDYTRFHFGCEQYLLKRAQRETPC